MSARLSDEQQVGTTPALSAPLTPLADMVRQEVAQYAAESATATFHAVLDDAQQIYSVIVVEPDKTLEVPVWVFVLARVVKHYIVIEQDTTLNKPLYEALMVNRHLPRAQIILAYQGETLPHVE
jgi:hypothetical protein